MRTNKEILDYLEEDKNRGFMAFASDILFDYLSLDALLSITNKEHHEEIKKEYKSIEQDPVAIRENMKKYMAEYGWPKVKGHRGITANRSVLKMAHWAWLLGKDDLVEIIGNTDYPQYGAPILKKVCEAMDFPIPTDEALQNMMLGKPCTPSCEAGCA